MLTGRNVISFSGSDGPGGQPTYTMRFTQVWLLANDGWKRACFQATAET